MALSFISRIALCLCLFNLYFPSATSGKVPSSILGRIQRNDNTGAGFQDPVQLALERHQKRPRNLNTLIGIDHVPSASNGAASVDQTVEESPIPQSLIDSRKSACGKDKECQKKMESEFRRIEWLKKTVLQKLKLATPPNVTENNKVPLNSPVMRALLKEYGIDQTKLHQDEDDMEDEIKNQKLISTAKRPPFNSTTSSENWFYFEFAPEERENFRVQSANIWYYVRSSSTPSASATVELDVYRPYLNQTDGETAHYAQRHTVERLNITGGRNTGMWKRFSVTSLASGWLRNPETNFGVKLFSKQVRNLIATGQLSGEEGYKPFLKVQLVADHHRRKRSASSSSRCQTQGGRVQCCAHDFKINFHDIGWDWIIFPTSYNAKYCTGECVATAVPSIHSTIVEATQYRQITARPAEIGRPNQPRSCCVPTKYAPLSMLYYDNQGNVVYSDVPDMEIKKCGCV